MSVTFRLSDFANMTPAERAGALEALVSAARSADDAGSHVHAARIRGFEERYEMSSDEMLDRLASGAMEETAEIAQWLFLLSAR